MLDIDSAINYHSRKAKELRERAKVMEDRIATGQDIIACAQESVDCEACAVEQEVLAEWLKDYKRLKSLNYHEDSYYLGLEYRVTYIEFHEEGAEDYAYINLYKAKDKHLKGGKWFDDENWELFVNQSPVELMDAEGIKAWAEKIVNEKGDK